MVRMGDLIDGVRPLASVRFTPDLPLAVGGGHIVPGDGRDEGRDVPDSRLENDNSEQAWHGRYSSGRGSDVRDSSQHHEFAPAGAPTVLVFRPVVDRLAFHDRRARTAGALQSW